LWVIGDSLLRNRTVPSTIPQGSLYDKIYARRKTIDTIVRQMPTMRIRLSFSL
jgi:hypothetical protein